jgi:site-specific DNA-methyltransferase (adenine-specific)|tara:strand:- start:356 stop:1150 length:795 start_codon:yes stop_codon:yes gene_type:complete
MPTVLPTTKHPTKLFNCHCFDLFKRIPDQSIDLVLTDPPYGTTACKWDSIIPLEPMWEQLKRVIKSNGVVAMTASQPFTSILVTSNIKMYKHEWIWIKNRGSNFANTVREPMKEHESVLIFSNGKWIYNKQMQERTGGGRDLIGKTVGTGQEQRKGVGNFKEFKPIKSLNKLRVPSTWQKFNTEVGLHPTQKPILLMEYLIKTYTNEDETVLDFAMGSGTTGVACKSLNRLFIGCDIDIENGYFEIARDRIKYAPPSNLPNNPQ